MRVTVVVTWNFPTLHNTVDIRDELPKRFCVELDVLVCRGTASAAARHFDRSEAERS